MTRRSIVVLLVVLVGYELSAQTPRIDAPSVLRKLAANTWALVNGTNIQELEVYRTFTDASNYERLRLGWTGGTAARIGTQQAGTGTERTLRLMVGGTDEWEIGTSGDLSPVSANDTNIGANGAEIQYIYLDAGSEPAGTECDEAGEGGRLAVGGGKLLVCDQTGAATGWVTVDDHSS